LTIAGSDSSAGAGVQADLKTFAAMGVYGVNAITAIVAEAPGSVSAFSAVDPTLFCAQLDRVKASFPVAAIKTGMLANRKLARETARFCRAMPAIPLIIDPIIRASAGTSFLSSGGRSYLKRKLLPIATLVTPNLPEAELLLGRSLDTRDSALGLHEKFGCNFLVKAGQDQSQGSEVIDYACIDGALHEFPHPRLAVPDLHGTGCTLSAAITARLAHGDDLVDAIEKGIHFLGEAMQQHFLWPEPDASRALNHFPNGVDSKEP
jgi:hydroxymethylpyrimidine/phosphomethylpyrimidine kinase